MTTPYTLCIVTEDTPGVLHRITVMFTRRKINIDSLTVSQCEHQGMSRFSIVIRTDRDIAEKVTRQIRRVVEVRDVELCEEEQLFQRETALVRVACSHAGCREAIERLVEQHSAQLLHVGDHEVILEKSGSGAQIDALAEALASMRVTQFVRSGRIALPREMRAVSLDSLEDVEDQVSAA